MAMKRGDMKWIGKKIVRNKKTTTLRTKNDFYAKQKITFVSLAKYGCSTILKFNKSTWNHHLCDIVRAKPELCVLRKITSIRTQNWGDEKQQTERKNEQAAATTATIAEKKSS